MFEGIIYGIKSLLNKPFKVGIISYYYPLEKSKVNNGVAIHTYYLSRELAKMGCEVHVFTRAWGKAGIKIEYIDKGKLILHKLNTDFDTPLRDNITKIRMSYTLFGNQVTNELTKENSRDKFDVVHTHGWLTAGAFLAKQLNNISWIHTFHSVEKNRLKFMTEEEKNYSNIERWVESTIIYADSLIAVSSKIKSEILKNYPVKKDKITIIFNGIDDTLYNTENNVQMDKRVLYVGRFSLEKGIDMVYKIAKKILDSDKEVKFEMVASGNKIPSLNKLTADFENLEKEYRERFIWHKELVNRQDLAKLYKAASVYIQPSRYEACPLCLIEAMSCGKAVICTNRGGMPEVVGNAGILVPFNTHSFVKNIFNLFADSDLREKYGKRAAERTKSWTWEKVAAETMEVYKKIRNEEIENLKNEENLVQI